MARTPTGSSSSTRPSSEPGTVGATPSSRRLARPGCGCKRTRPSPCWTLPGTTTGRCCRAPRESSGESAACAGGLLEELPQRLGCDRRSRRASAGREQLQEAAEADVVQHGRGLDDLGHDLTVSWIEDAAQAVREVVWQLAHGLAETIKPMQPVVIGDVIWEPSPEVIARSRLKRFMDRHRIETFDELLKRADDDIEWFWDAAIKDIDVAFYRDYDKVVDLSQGKPWAKWWVGGRMNIIQSCLDRHRNGPSHDKTAIIWEGEPGDVRKLSYAELDQQVSRLAGALRRMGIRQGDRVGIFMPMCPEVAVSVLATAKIGAVIIPLFSGYGPDAIATRLRDGEAKVLICADGFYRRGHVVAMKETADRALVSCPTVKKVIVHRRVVREIPWTHGRDEVWEVLLEDQPDRASTQELDPEDPLMIIYTSGTTGKPKGTLHVHGGVSTKTAPGMGRCFHIWADARRFCCTHIRSMLGP